MLPAASQLIAFLAASLALAVTPGPAVLYLLARTLSQGLRHGLASVAGIALGNLGNAWAASLGIAALIAAWPAALDVVRVAGAAWLVRLAWLAWRAPVADRATGPAPAATSVRRTFVDGAAVALLNPKTALFFAAFVPQFIGTGPADSPVVQALALSTLFVVLAAATDTAWALLASRVAPRFARSSPGRWPARASAAVYAGLAAYALLA